MEFSWLIHVLISLFKKILVRWNSRNIFCGSAKPPTLTTRSVIMPILFKESL